MFCLYLYNWRAQLLIGNWLQKVASSTQKYILYLNVSLLNLFFVTTYLVPTIIQKTSISLYIVCTFNTIVVIVISMILTEIIDWKKYYILTYILVFFRPINRLFRHSTGGPRIVRIQTVQFHYSAVNILVPKYSILKWN